MKKRIVALMAVFTMAVGLLGGCGNKNADTNTTSAQSETETDQEAADKVAALIDAIYVQERTDKTDEQCAAAKEAWDKLQIRITSAEIPEMRPKTIR